MMWTGAPSTRSDIISLWNKKWPFQNSQTAFSLAAGFVWESAKKYMGVLAAGREENDFHFLSRPNIKF